MPSSEAGREGDEPVRHDIKQGSFDHLVRTTDDHQPDEQQRGAEERTKVAAAAIKDTRKTRKARIVSRIARSSEGGQIQSEFACLAAPVT